MEAGPWRIHSSSRTVARNTRKCFYFPENDKKLDMYFAGQANDKSVSLFY
jgi:hypothetical protein